jgi:hypothetical protein
VLEGGKGMELNGSQQLMVYVDDNVLDEIINTIKKNTEAGLKVNQEKTKYMVLSRH